MSSGVDDELDMNNNEKTEEEARPVSALAAIAEVEVSLVAAVEAAVQDGETDDVEDE